jgi:hypothetical protein
VNNRLFLNICCAIHDGKKQRSTNYIQTYYWKSKDKNDKEKTLTYSPQSNKRDYEEINKTKIFLGTSNNFLKFCLVSAIK